MPVQLKMNVSKNYKVLEKPAYLKKTKERKVGQKNKIGVLASMRKLLKMCSIKPQRKPQHKPQRKHHSKPQSKPQSKPHRKPHHKPQHKPQCKPQRKP